MDVVGSGGFNRFEPVDGMTDHIEQAAFDGISGGHGDGFSQCPHFHAAAQAVGGVHGDGADGILTNGLLGFEDEFFAVVARDLECIEQIGEVIFLVEGHVDDWANDLSNVSCDSFIHWSGCVLIH